MAVAAKQLTCKCGNVVPYEHDYCWKCGRSLLSQKPRPEVAVLALTDDAALEKLILKLDLFMNPEEWVQAARDVFPTIKPLYQQVLIRLYGLDGNPPRTHAEVAREYRNARGTIYDRAREALWDLEIALADSAGDEFLK